MTKTDIFNQALSRLGDATQIASDAENTPNAIACRAHYDRVRQELLRGHPWNFATTRAILEPEDDAPAFGFKYQFELPENCLHVTQGNKRGDKYRVEGRFILSDASSIQLIYVRDVETISLFDSTFVEALVLHLASAIAMDVAHSMVKRDNLLQDAKNVLANARWSDSTEDKKPVTLSPLRGRIPTDFEAEPDRVETVSRGASGWTPQLAIVEASGRRVIQILGWIGGEGSDPATGYVGPSGLVSNPVDALGLGGEDGLSAYALAVDGGFSGSVEDWLESLIGEQGETGDIGPIGPAGPEGVAGGAGASWEHATTMLLMGA